YSDLLLQAQHAHMLYIYSQARLNLDNYQGALDILDEYESYGYFHDWYPGSRAWILMKLGRLDDAIKTARLGILQGAEPGRTLNMLGILLSMTGEREESLRVFKEAIRYELSLGISGQPATPLNNSGEVYKEIFFDEKAESSWLKATSLPDGCEHILPSLNLALLYIDQLNFTGAKKSLDNFEACFTQYPLRNDEEHRALLHLGRGRIDLQTGKIDSAIDHFEAAVDRRQWFGKIGTNEDDLAAASLYSLGQALKAKNIALRYKITDNIWDSLNHAKIRWQNYLRSWWLWRKASQILAEDLNDFEDLNVRHTDTMLEYTTLGSLLSLIPNSILAKKILKENRSDPRHEASIYYKAYLGESELRNGNKKHGLENINQALESAREPYDNLLTVHLLALKALYGDNSQEQINRLVTKIYSIHPPSVRNYGLKLPISFAKIDEDISEDLLDSAFIHQPESKLIIDTKSVGSSTKLVFNSSSRPNIEHTINKDSVTESLNEFIDKIFSM
ncbi:MAG: hypothetical protein R3A13_11700, partial [Bdellovibrionota bacterium]